MASRTIAGSRSLVTGASGGIGRAIALELARRGSRMVLLARREEPLRAAVAEIMAAGGAAEAVVGDVTDATVRQAALNRAREAFGGLDILVNNAGFGALGHFEDAPPDQLRKIFEVNFFAAAELIRESLPLLKQGERPIVVNVASILGHRATPRNSEYCASKFALIGLSESIRAELAKVGVEVLVVSPGSTESEFFEHSIGHGRSTPWPTQPRVPAAAVAQATVRAIERGKHEIIPNFRGWLLCWLNRLAPRLVDRIMERYG
jgi:short-subunit dehydrogenase